MASEDAILLISMGENSGEYASLTCISSSFTEDTQYPDQYVYKTMPHPVREGKLWSIFTFVISYITWKSTVVFPRLYTEPKTYSCGWIIIDTRVGFNAYSNLCICAGQVERFKDVCVWFYHSIIFLYGSHACNCRYMRASSGVVSSTI